jgi:hypothetical protein
MKTKKLAVVAGLALGLAATYAQAGIYSFEDDDIDFILRPTTAGGAVSATPITSGPFRVGDVFTSVIEVPVATLNGVNIIPAGQELTGVAAVQLLSCGGVSIFGSACTGQYVFGAYTGGLNSILALGSPDPDASVGASGNAGGGAVIGLWLNGTAGGVDRNLDLNRSTNPATNCTSLADCIDQASLGSLFQVDGFTTDPDNFWTASALFPGANDIGTVLGTGNSTIVAAANFGLGNFFNALGPIGYQNLSGVQCAANAPVADGCVQFLGSATLTGGAGLSNGAIAHSDFDATKYSVPEPMSLALVGVALLGLGMGRRSRKS